MINATNILVIKLGALGDFVISFGMMAEIRRLYPRARITLLTGNAFKGIAGCSGLFDEILIDDRERWNFSAWYRIIKKDLLDHAFDLVIDLQRADRTLVCYFQFMRWLSRKELKWLIVSRKEKWDVRTIHPRRKPFPAAVTEEQTDAFFPHTETNLAFCKGPQQYFNLLPKTYALLIPGCSAGHPFKRWPAASYAALAKRICDSGVSVVAMGTEAEKEAVEEMTASEPRIVNFLGKSTLLDIPALAMRASVVIGNDTGPVHMASYCPVPVVALFSERTAGAMRKSPNVTNLCGKTIDAISVDAVWDAVRPLLEKRQNE